MALQPISPVSRHSMERPSPEEASLPNMEPMDVDSMPTEAPLHGGCLPDSSISASSDETKHDDKANWIEQYKNHQAGCSECQCDGCQRQSRIFQHRTAFISHMGSRHPFDDNILSMSEHTELPPEDPESDSSLPDMSAALVRHVEARRQQKKNEEQLKLLRKHLEDLKHINNLLDHQIKDQLTTLIDCKCSLE